MGDIQAKRGIILLNDDPRLFKMLQELGIKRSTYGEESHQFSWISAKACKKAGIDFRFFQAFARLTQMKEGRVTNPTQEILNSVDREETVQPRSILPSVRYGAPNRGGVRDIKEMISQFRAREKQNSPKRVDPQSFQKKADAFLDSSEAQVLRAALLSLEGSLSQADFPGFDRGLSDAGQVSQVRQRANELAKHPCWLGPQALRLGIFGAINGESDHFLGVTLYAGLVPLDRETTTAQKFSCSYLPSMREYLTGLSLPPRQMPQPVQRASQSVLVLEGEEARGVGVLINSKGYILTARHVLAAFETGEASTLTIRVPNQGESSQASLNIVSVPGNHLAEFPDLVLLYVPEWGNKVPTITPPPKVWPEGKTSAELNIPVVEKGTPPHIPGGIFQIGIPNQEPPLELLVGAGEIDPVTSLLDGEGMVHTTAPGLPGNSGGPVVDRQGRLMGIVSALRIESSEEKRGMETILRGKITGSKIYHMAHWQESIERAIQAHQESLPESEKK